MHERDRADAPHRFLDGDARFGRREPASLKPEERRDRLQVVLHPVVDLADRRVLRDELAVTTSEVGDVAQNGDRRACLCSIIRTKGMRQHLEQQVGSFIGVDEIQLA